MAEVKELRTYTNYQQYNFFRTADWRWERILALTDRPGQRPGRCTRRDDAKVREAKAFIGQRNKADAAGLDRLLQENPGLFYAYEFHQRTQDDAEAAFYVQARLLAKQTPEQIAAVMGVMPESVQWYADLFFDVMPYLERRDWITKQVLLPAMVRSAVDEKSGKKKPTEENPGPAHLDRGIVARPFMDGTLKLFAYFGGTHLVDLMISGLQAGKPLTSPDDVDNWMDRTVGTTLRRRAAQASQTFEINKYNVMELFNAHAKLLEIARSEDNQDQARSTMERHIKATIDEIPWSAGADGTKLFEGTMLGRFDDMAPELRDDELIQLASGRRAETVARDNFPASLPPPRKDKKSALMTRDDPI